MCKKTLLITLFTLAYLQMAQNRADNQTAHPILYEEYRVDGNEVEGEIEVYWKKPQQLIVAVISVSMYPKHGYNPVIWMPHGQNQWRLSPVKWTRWEFSWVELMAFASTSNVPVRKTNQ